METALAFVAQVIRISIPYGLGAVGGAFSERGGVVNIALEGIFLVGAFGAVWGTIGTGSPWLGLLTGVCAGLLLAAIHALVTVRGKADQILSGLALNLLAVGATRSLLKLLYGSASNSPRIEGITGLGLHLPPGFEAVAEIVSSPFFILAVIAIVAGEALLFGTGFGLALRAAGDGPRALDGAGLSVGNLRVTGVLLSGVFGGLAGSWLAMEQHNFTDGMSSGRGYIALAAMIVGKWRPLGGALACLLFGAAETLQIRIHSDKLPSQFLQMTPYLVTLVVLAGWIGRATPPRALGEAYDRESAE
ncbi:MAG: ABC transporter permease [Candidatus Eisenbacteria bacterium]